MLFGLAAGVADWAGRVGTPSLLSDSRECGAPGDQRGVAGAGEGVSPGWGWRWSAAAAQVVTRQQSHGNLLQPPHRATAARTAPPAEMGFSNLVSCKVEVK